MPDPEVAAVPLAPLHLAPRPPSVARALPWVVLVSALVGVPLLWALGVLGITTVNQLGRFATYAIAALGIDLIWGYTGILSLCQAMFFCLGGYAMGMYLALHGPLDGDGIPRCLYVVSSEVSGLHLPTFWRPFQSGAAAGALGILVPAMVAFIFGALAFRSRIRGVYFSIITQAATVMAWLIFCRNSVRLCGTNGLTNFVTIAGWDLRNDRVRVVLYAVSVAVLALSYLCCRLLIASRAGRILIAVRDNESRLRFTGYDPAAYKTFAFVLAAVQAAIGGMLYVPQNGIITPAKMVAAESITMVVWVAVGGRGTLVGAMLGAVVVSLVSSELTSHWPSAWPFVLGGSFILLVIFCPEGLLGLLRRWRKPRGATVVATS